MSRFLRFGAVLAAGLTAACGGGGSHGCDVAAQSGCAEGKVCAEVVNAKPACFDPVELHGTAYELGQDPAAAPVAGARVVALDANDAPLGAVAISGLDGAYVATVPVARNADGSPAGAQVRLRADARGYETFPGGVRVAVPIVLSAETATHLDGRWVVESTLTDVGLVPVTDATLTASLHGVVSVPPDRAGVLVVAERTVSMTDPATNAPASVVRGATAIADRDGGYAIYNLPPADYTVRAIAKGSAYATQAKTLAANEDAAVDLARLGAAPAQVTGRLNPVSGASGASSVILALRSTFDDPFGTGLPLGRAVAIPGLRLALPDPGAPFAFTGVPPGDYVVLAAFENDGLVRQVSGQGGTQPAFVSVADGSTSVALPSDPKIVPAVALTGPGADPAAVVPEIVTGTPSITWSPYASTSYYAIELFDASGTLVWSQPDPILVQDPAAPSDPTKKVFNTTGAYAPGSCTASGCAVAAPGSVLVPGATYQARVTAWGVNASRLVPFSRSEDLLGIFTWEPAP